MEAQAKKPPLWMTLHMIQESAVVKARSMSRSLGGRIAIWYAGAVWVDRLLVLLSLCLGGMIVWLHFVNWCLDQVRP